MLFRLKEPYARSPAPWKRIRGSREPERKVSVARRCLITEKSDDARKVRQRPDLTELFRSY